MVMIKGNGGRLNLPNVANGGIPLIGEDPATRAKRCGIEIDKLVKSFNCQIMPVTVIVGNQVTQRIDVIPMEQIKPI